MFQSPKSGKFESNTIIDVIYTSEVEFQSPKSGKFESNGKYGKAFFERLADVSIP